MGAEKWGIIQRRKNHKEKSPRHNEASFWFWWESLRRRLNYDNAKKMEKLLEESLIWGEMAGLAKGRKLALGSQTCHSYSEEGEVQAVWTDVDQCEWMGGARKFSSVASVLFNESAQSGDLKESARMFNKERHAEGCESEWILEIQQVCWGWFRPLEVSSHVFWVKAVSIICFPLSEIRAWWRRNRKGHFILTSAEVLSGGWKKEERNKKVGKQAKQHFNLVRLYFLLMITAYLNTFLIFFFKKCLLQFLSTEFLQEKVLTVVFPSFIGIIFYLLYWTDFYVFNMLIWYIAKWFVCILTW